MSDVVKSYVMGKEKLVITLVRNPKYVRQKNWLLHRIIVYEISYVKI